MTARHYLGDAFNLDTSETTSGNRVNLKNATGVYIVALTATSGNVTISEANAASGGTSQSIASGVTEFWTSASGVWTRNTQVAGATVACATGGLLAVYVSAAQLSSGFTYVSASHSTAHLAYVIVGLQSKRDPNSLANARS